MTMPPEHRRRHLSVVPDLPGASDHLIDRQFRTPALYAVDSESPQRDHGITEPVAVVLPAGTTTADLIKGLTELGAPQPFLDRATGFGDDVQALSVWLRDYGPVFSERQWAGDLLDRWTALLEPGADALDAEIFGNRFLATYEDLLIDPEGIGSLQQLISEAVESRRPEALAMVRVLAQIGPAAIRSAAVAAAEHLVGSGVADQVWASSLGADEFVGASTYVDALNRRQVLALRFRLDQRVHNVAVVIDHAAGGGVRDCWWVAEPTSLSENAGFAAATNGARLTECEGGRAGILLNDALAAPPCPSNSEQAAHVRVHLPMLNARTRLLACAQVIPIRPVGRRGPAPSVHQIKVTLRDTQPPIWRRLQLASTCSLAQLHLFLQDAFGWTGSHLWTFEGGDGEYGDPDPDSEVRDASRFTLTDIAAAPASTFEYRYDFGDNWVHEIVVEQVRQEPGNRPLPRCTAGRRAAPPEDCGGPAGYRALLAEIQNPFQPEGGRLPPSSNSTPSITLDPTEFHVGVVNQLLRARSANSPTD
jgi:hypothetical protein